MSKPSTIVIMGLGFVGLTFAVFLALKKFNVIGVDIDKKKIDEFAKGNSYFIEPGLNNSLKKALKKSLTFLDSVQKIESADIIFVTVGTPAENDGSIDLRYIQSASEDLSTWIQKSKKF